MRIRIASDVLGAASIAALRGLEADLAFCHPAIRGVASVDGAAVELDVDEDGEELRAQVRGVIELSVASYRFLRSTPPLWRHEALARYAGGRAGIDGFVARHVIELGPGQYAYTGAAARLRLAVDARLQAIARRVGAEPWHLPSIEQTGDLMPATGYLASHGQYLTFGYRLPCHFEKIRRFAGDAKARGLERPDDPRDLVPTGFVLEPFVCHNVYRALRGAVLDEGRAITALGTCYRHEGFRFVPLVRQWEFSMREVVLVGPPAYVAAQRDRTLVMLQELAAALDLDARLEIATDPFFVSEAAAARTYQAMSSTKLELALALDDHRACAAASLNLHGTHFTAPMQIKAPGGALLETACIGVGVERWVAAIVARWGASPEGWPLEI